MHIPLPSPPSPSRMGALQAACDALDRGVAAELDALAASSRRTSACRAGCSHCCTDLVPLTALEIEGITACALRVAGKGRQALKRRLMGRRPADQCPFLDDGCCQVYPMRPLACRQYHILGEPCRPGERVDVSRWPDLYKPSPRMRAEALRHMLPHIPGLSEEDRRQALARGHLTTHTLLIRSVDWRRLARCMAAADRTIPAAGLDSGCDSS